VNHCQWHFDHTLEKGQKFPIALNAKPEVETLFNKPNSYYLRFLGEGDGTFSKLLPSAVSNSCIWSTRYFALWQIFSSWSSMTWRRQQTALLILIRRCCHHINTQYTWTSS